MDNLLLMTATIKPYENVPILKVTDTAVRLKHYQSALEKYICFSDFNNIVLVDNSNYPFEKEFYIELARENGKKFEYITFIGDKEKMITCGKSYGEGEIIEFALKNSKLLKKADYFYKVSGRYYLKNNKVILKKLNKNYNYFAPWNYQIRKQFGIDTVFFGCKKTDWWKYFKGKHEEANEYAGYAFEHILYRVIHNSSISYRYLPVSPQYDVPVQASTGEQPIYVIWKELYKLIYLSISNLILNLKKKISPHRY